MKILKFIDMQYGGGCVDTEKSRCLAARYNAQIGYHKAERSGVMCAISNEDILLDDRGGRTWLVV